MKPGRNEAKPAVQTPLLRDRQPLVDLAQAGNDADDQSDAGRPTTEHDAKGWRAIPAGNP